MLCIGSGKGGVGKSTLTANLAAALRAEGKRVGVLDADVWGYSIPRMFGLGATRPDVSAERKIIPLESHGVKVMSIGFFVEEDAAVVWRGPMLHKALTQFLQDVEWGALDYLLVDLPPGTGDVSMTLAQLLPQAKFLIVTTPQPTAQKVARRSAQMADKVDLEIGGVIENMSSFTTPSGERFTIFGEGGGQELADELDVPLLGKVPLTMPLREQADGGLPLVIENPDDPAAQAIRQVARGLIAMAPLPLPVLPLVEVSPSAGPPRRAGNPWACRCRWPEPRAIAAARHAPACTRGAIARGGRDVAARAAYPALDKRNPAGRIVSKCQYRTSRTCRMQDRERGRPGAGRRGRIRRTPREDGTAAGRGDRPLPAGEPARPDADRGRARRPRPGAARAPASTRSCTTASPGG